MPRFSIIVPVYNVAPYIEQCINSIISQTYLDFELILVDDGSKDDGGAICDKWADKDSRVRVIHQENSGISVARNNGISISQGEYILFLDSDDYWSHVDVLKIITSRLDKTEADVLSFNYYKTDGERRSPGYFSMQKNMPAGLKGEESLKYQIENDLWIACAWNKVIRKELFDDHRLDFICGITSEDIDWCVRLAMLANNFDFIADEIVCYRQRNESISKSPSVQKVRTFINNVQNSLNIINKAENKEKAEIIKPYMAYQCATLLFTISWLDNKKDREELSKKTRDLHHLLNWSRNPKVRVVRAMVKVFGLRCAIELLRLVYILKH